MTAFVIPNAIQITTRQSKYTFASFLSRDTTYDVIHNIWRLARPEDASSLISASRPSLDGSSRVGIDESRDGPTTSNGSIGGAQVVKNKMTHCPCSKDGSHYNEVSLDTVFPGTPDRIHNLIFASGFIKDFLRVDQKLLGVYFPLFHLKQVLRR